MAKSTRLPVIPRERERERVRQRQRQRQRQRERVRLPENISNHWKILALII